MIKLPTQAGYYVEWDEAPFITKSGKIKIQRGLYETTNIEEAKRVKAEKEAVGFRNVTIGECIF